MTGKYHKWAKTSKIRLVKQQIKSSNIRRWPWYFPNYRRENALNLLYFSANLGLQRSKLNIIFNYCSSLPYYSKHMHTETKKHFWCLRYLPVSKPWHSYKSGEFLGTISVGITGLVGWFAAIKPASQISASYDPAVALCLVLADTRKQAENNMSLMKINRQITIYSILYMLITTI